MFRLGLWLTVGGRVSVRAKVVVNRWGNEIFEENLDQAVDLVFSSNKAFNCF